MRVKHIVLIILFSFNQILLSAQETSIYTERNVHLKNGLLLIEEQKYSAAQKEFELLFLQTKSATDNDAYTLRMFAEFYNAYCSFKLENQNIERLFKNFINNYHETNLRSKAHFYLGNYYFKNNKISEALSNYEKVDAKELTNQEMIEFKFNNGYAYFKKKDFAKAKPLFKEIKNSKHKYYEPANYYYGFISFYDEQYKEAENSFELLKDSELYKNDVPYYLVQIYFLRKDYQKVIEYATPMLSKNVENLEEISHIVGQAHFELKDYVKAVPLLKRYIDTAKKVNKEELYQLAYAQYKTQDFSSAIENFKQLNIVEDSLGQNAMYALADAYLKTNQKALARDAFQKSARMNFDPIAQEISAFMYAKLSLELDFTNIAIASLTAFLENYPKSIYRNEAGELLSISLLQTKNYAKAIDILENFKITSANAERTYQLVTFYRAVELYNDKNFDEALTTVNKSLQKNIDADVNGLATFLRGNIHYEKNNFAQAITDFSRFKQINVKDKSALQWASKELANYYIAYAYFKQKKYADASTYFEEAITQFRKSNIENDRRLMRDAVLRNADCLFMTKNYNRALNNYDEIINNKWVGAEYALLQKSIIFGLQNKQTEKINTLRKLTSEFPNSIYTAEAYFETGKAFLSEGNLSQAAEQFTLFTERFPGDNLVPDAYLKLGLIYFNLDNESKSLDFYKKVVQTYPNSAEAKQALPAIKEIFVNMGQPDEYFRFIQNQTGVAVSASEQDSLIYKSAEKKYFTGDCNGAIKGFNDYLNAFPRGFFFLNAHFYRGECHFRAKDYEKAYPDYKRVIEQGRSNNYENALLKATFIAYEINNNVTEAHQLYARLYQDAALKSNREVALVGLLRTNFRMEKHAEVLKYSNEILNDSEFKDEVKTEASFYKAKSLFATNRLSESQTIFSQLVSKIPISVIKAESAYHLNLITHKNGEFQKSLDACFAFNSDYASYEYWLVKNFILIADNYFALNNTFQAKATLQSILDNYKGDQKLIDEAQNKLNEITSKELEKSKVIIETQNVDTIEFKNQNR